MSYSQISRALNFAKPRNIEYTKWPGMAKNETGSCKLLKTIKIIDGRLIMLSV